MTTPGSIQVNALIRRLAIKQPPDLAYARVRGRGFSRQKSPLGNCSLRYNLKHLLALDLWSALYQVQIASAGQNARMTGMRQPIQYRDVNCWPCANQKPPNLGDNIAG
jgi:hypothetical protein